MPRLKAKKPMRYASRRLEAGDEFEANSRDARVLKAIGKAEDAPEIEPVRRGPGRPRKAEVMPEPESAAAVEAVEEESPRHYQRRDMVAEEP